METQTQLDNYNLLQLRQMHQQLKQFMGTKVFGLFQEDLQSTQSIMRRNSRSCENLLQLPLMFGAIGAEEQLEVFGAWFETTLRQLEQLITIKEKQGDA